MQAMHATFQRLPAPLRVLTLLLVLACAPAGAVEYSAEDRLILAADSGDLAAVTALLKSGVDANYQLQPGRSALTVAVSKGHLQVVEALLAAKADPNLGRKQKNSPLYAAASGKHWEMVLPLLAANADPDFADSSGQTPLFFAAQAGRQDIVKALVAAGADPSPRVTFGGGRSALYWVTMGRDFDMALLLVKLGANGNDATDYQDTPLRQASAGKTDKQLELVRALLATHVDTERGQLPQYKITPACVPPSSEAVCVQRLRTARGTALGIAAGFGSPEIVQALIDAKAYVDARQDGRRTPLMIAATGGRADVVRLLLAAGADVQAKDSDSNTALMLAEEKGHREVADILRSAMAGPSNR
jgi:uncharacterized protein